MAACDPSGLIAASKCFECLSMKQLLMVEVQLLCDILVTGGGGGGGGLQYVFSGNYGGGVPTDVPVASAAFAIDTSNGTIWSWYSGNWH